MTVGASAVTVERFRWWHIEQVTSVEADLFGAEKWSAAMFWNELASGHHYVVAVDGEQVLGYAGLAIAPPTKSPGPGRDASREQAIFGNEAWVQNIAVRREAQRRGIGRMLLEALLDQAARKGARKVLLEVAVDNGPAQKLYAQYGFEGVALRRGYYQPSNTDALVMLCQLKCCAN